MNTEISSLLVSGPYDEFIARYISSYAAEFGAIGQMDETDKHVLFRQESDSGFMFSLEARLKDQISMPLPQQLDDMELTAFISAISSHPKSYSVVCHGVSYPGETEQGQDRIEVLGLVYDVRKITCTPLENPYVFEAILRYADIEQIRTALNLKSEKL